MDLGVPQLMRDSPRYRWTLLGISGALLLGGISLLLCASGAGQEPGPMVQDVTSDGFTVVWWDRGAVAAELDVNENKGPLSRITATHEGSRWQARAEGLTGGSVYTYRIAGLGRWGTVTRRGGGEVRTAAGSGEPFSFAVLGDTGHGDRQTRLLAERLREYHPDFVLHTGDLVYDRGARAAYPSHFFRPFRALMARIPIYPVPGNHDLMEGQGRAYYSTFERPSGGTGADRIPHHYCFEYGGARIAALDSNLDADELSRVVAPWVANRLTDYPGWRFVFMHHPPYSAGGHGSDPRLQACLAPAFDAARVHVVFSGHNHDYVRTLPLQHGDESARGTVYVTSGAGSAALESPVERLPPFVASAAFGTASFTWVEVRPDRLRLRQIAFDGRVLDEATILPDGQVRDGSVTHAPDTVAWRVPSTRVAAHAMP